MKIKLLTFSLLLGFFSCEESEVQIDKELDKEWILDSPESVDLNGDILNELTEKLNNGDLGLVSSLLIIKDEKLVYENYRMNMSSDKLHSNYSVTKSITSMLFGIAINEGLLTSIESPAFEFFPAYAVGDGKKDITVKQLLEMRAGFEWDELTYNYGSPLNSTTELNKSTDWMKYVWDRPLSRTPGEWFTYNSGCTLLLSGILEHQSGETVEEFAVSRLFDPIGINNFQWLKTPTGKTNTGWGLSLRSRDMAKIGLLFLNQGAWQGNQIIPTEWIEESTMPYTRFTGGYGYGYQWWLYPFDLDGTQVLIPYADGYGDQFIFVVNPLNMVVVMTSEAFNRETSFVYEILSEYILKSAVN